MSPPTSAPTPVAAPPDRTPFVAGTHRPPSPDRHGPGTGRTPAPPSVDRMTDTRPALATLPLGLIRRSLLEHADGRHDVTTSVFWLQGLSLYCDLRRPADRPD